MKKALVAGAALGVASSAIAADFTVTNGNDSGAGSLRQAILDANANPGPDTVSIVSGSTITLTSGQMVISDSVVIQSTSPGIATVDANQVSRVFYVYNPSPVPVDVTISRLRLREGRSVVAGDPSASAGGAIRVVGENLALDDVEITDSVAAGDGGAIAFFGIDSTGSYNPVPAALSIQNSVLSGNTANYVSLPIHQGGCGGGLWVGGIHDVLLDDVTIENNQARCDGGGFAGTDFQDGGNVTIQSSVISGNTAGAGAAGDGGGVSLANESPGSLTSVSIVDTQITGNSTDGSSGGLEVRFVGELTVERTTISGNTADDGAGGAGIASTGGAIVNSTIAQNSTAGSGGALSVSSANLAVEHTTISSNTALAGPGIQAAAASRVEIENSIVANSVGGPDLGNDGDSSFGVRYSLIEDPGTADIDDGGGNVFGADPQLAAPAGFRLTMMPAVTSPAVNAGDPAFVPPPSTDQLGDPRVKGGRIDMGSVELQSGTLQFSVAAQSVNEDAGTVTVTVVRHDGFNRQVLVVVGVDGSSTATAGTDYVFAGTSVVFLDGDTTPRNIVIPIVDDGTAEPPETIVLRMTSSINAPIGTPSTHTITIVDDDGIVPPDPADLSIEKELEPGPLTVGEEATFTITVTNGGAGAAADVVVSDTLPAQLSLVSATPSAGSCSGTVTITCNLGTLSPAASETITIVATMTSPGTATNTAEVSSPSDPTDGSDSVTFTIGGGAELAAVPALDPRMQLLLAALVAAAASIIIRRT